MGVSWSFTPPKIDALPRLVAAGAVAVEAAAEHLLEASQRLVPLDTGALAASGEATSDGMEAAVSYGREDGAGRDGRDTADYAVIVHERLDVHHPHGQAKWLESTLHSERETVAALLAEKVREALKL